MLLSPRISPLEMKTPAALRILLVAFLAFVIHHSANAAPLSGTKSIGPTGDYASLTATIADVQAWDNGRGGALMLDSQATYLSTVETFPLTIPALNGVTAVYTLTIANTSIASVTLCFINEASDNTFSN